MQRSLPQYTVLQLDGRLKQYVLPTFDLGSSHWSHEAHISIFIRQAGAFLAHTWRAAPGTLEWVRLNTSAQAKGRGIAASPNAGTATAHDVKENTLRKSRAIFGNACLYATLIGITR